MVHVDVTKLNPLESKIHNVLIHASKYEKDIKITRAAELCNCSVSKISKFVNKLGFTNYKQYIHYVYGYEIIQKKHSSELERIKHFIENFDDTLVDKFIEQLNNHDKIILFGYGPSYICAQYFEYRLRLVTNKVVIGLQDEITAINLLDENSLMIVFSTTGQFKAFDSMYEIAKSKNSSFLLLLEEFNTALLKTYDNIIFLTNSIQSEALPYEKSRTVFFIFIEEIIQRLHLLKKNQL
ncbi:MurR/RpiR family transcriptional regulator [Paenibacillus pseudetheri]|uniref:SIS domain-containing protein n=1 Tax=Paenibacillus pseudetheri TaxID=2897682 RepID=A0ABN8FP32_9BACL|nr:SIS domain-containing protein [Paenibacillus pseudetheri]CAH1059813.1 hypothetical protein PAECIP111894_06025 [Paenibacillus pseudetheri]